MKNVTVVAALLAALFVLPPAGAADASKPCNGSEYRQFDYWLGDWDVLNGKGEKIGENRITLEQGGCVLHEHWTDVQGGTGESFNMYDAPRGVWHQTWVAGNGQLLLLEGGIKDGSMTLSGERPTRDGKHIVQDRISWIAQDDGSVHQVWEQSLDGGTTWKTGFLGIYRKKTQD